MAIADIARKFTGPRGTFRNGEVVARSIIQRTNYGDGVWQWVAFDHSGAVISVIDIPFVMSGFHDTPTGALWTLRDVLASHFHNARAHKETN